MMARSFLSAFLLLAVFLIVDIVWAQVSQDVSVVPAVVGHPIDMRLNFLGGMDYSLDGYPLYTYGEFENLIAPLGDYEATRLLRSSEHSKDISDIFGLPGFVALGVGITGLLAAPSKDQTGFWITTIAGGISWDISGFFGKDAESSKFNCVQRYNRFAYGREQILPKTPRDEKSLLPAGTTSTSATSVTQSGK